MTQPEISGEPRCRVCGCTETRACEGGCWWVEDEKMCDLCSSCAGATCQKRVIPLKERKIRLCGQPATRKVGDKFYCKRHGAKARGRAA